MSDFPVLPGIESQFVETARLGQHLLACGPVEAEPVLFVHGNFSAGDCWSELMLVLASLSYRCVAADLRGYGWTEAKPVDARRGYQDYASDLAELASALGWSQFHLAGWGLGGGIALQYVLDHPDQVLTVTLQAPTSPYGFGGTADIEGRACFDDFAGSGAGLVNPEFVKRLAAGDRSGSDPNSPRNVLNRFYYKPPFRAAREEDLLTAMLRERTGPQFYPGDFVPSVNWPNVAPGRWGPMNAQSPKYLGGMADALLALPAKPPVLWIRGADDQVISDQSWFDAGALGQLGLLPGWPGEDSCPPQPMVGQTRAVLERYASAGGSYREAVFDNCGHSPHIEYPAEWQQTFVPHTRIEHTGSWHVT